MSSKKTLSLSIMMWATLSPALAQSTPDSLPQPTIQLQTDESTLAPKKDPILSPWQKQTIPAITSENSTKDSIPTFDATDLLAQPLLLNRLLDHSVSHDDIEGIQLLLPVYQQLAPTFQDEILILFAQSKLALYQQDTQQAIEKLQQILQKRPDLPVIKLQLARLFLYQKYDWEAKQLLQTLDQDELPEAYALWLKTQHQQLKEKYKINKDIGLNYTYQDNINNATEIKTQYLETERQQDAHGIAYHASVNKLWSLAKAYNIHGEIDIDGRYYPQVKRYNEITLSPSLGLQKHYKLGYLEFSPFISRTWIGNINPEQSLTRYKDGKGFSITSQNILSPKWQQITFLRFEHAKHHPLYRGYNGEKYLMSNTLLYQNHPMRRYSLGWSYSYDDLHDANKSNHQWGISAGIVQRFTNGLAMQVRVTHLQQKYHGKLLRLVNPNDEYRKDHTWYLQTSIWHKNIKIFGVHPRLTYQYTKNDSNIDILYRYHKSNVYLELAKDF